METRCYEIDYSWKRGGRELQHCVTHAEAPAGLSNFELRQRFEKVLRKLRPASAGSTASSSKASSRWPTAKKPSPEGFPQSRQNSAGAV